MWTRQALEAAIAKRARNIPGLSAGNIYIGKPAAGIAGKPSAVVVLSGGSEFGRPALDPAPREFDIAVSAFVYADDRATVFNIAGELAPRLFGLSNVTVRVGPEDDEAGTTFVEVSVLAENLR